MFVSLCSRASAVRLRQRCYELTVKLNECVMDDELTADNNTKRFVDVTWLSA